MSDFLPLIAFLNWLAILPAVFSLFALLPLSKYANLTTIIISNYISLLLFVADSSNCDNFTGYCVSFLNRHWFLAISLTALICVMGGLIFGLVHNTHYQMTSSPSPSPLKLKKKRKKSESFPLCTEFSVDIDRLAREMSYLRRFSSNSMILPSWVISLKIVYFVRSFLSYLSFW